MPPRWLPPPDGARDPRIEDPSNRWLVHLVGRALLPLALRLGLRANAVSVAGLLLGAGGAAAFCHWREPAYATLGFLLCLLWMIADGLDGMIARATGTASPLGRFLDGLCDHAVFVLLYVALAASLGTAEAWLLASAAGLAHAFQATLYEGERTRFHRRIARASAPAAAPQALNPLVRLYDAVATGFDRAALPFDRALVRGDEGRALAARYAEAAVPPLRAMALLTNNMRVLLLWLACLGGEPRLFWWIELGPMSLLAAGAILRLRRIERRLVA